jgi:hypothetical protein
MIEDVKTVGTGKKYIIGDAVGVLQRIDEFVEDGQRPALFHLDDAWARPHRAEQFGVTYETHDFKQEDDNPDNNITTTDIIDACKDALVDGGWLIADADDWLLPQLITYIQETWGNVAEDYRGGGYRRIGGVTYVDKSSHEKYNSGNFEPNELQPDRSTAGSYLSNGGYPVVFAQKGESNRRSSIAARQITSNHLDNYGWGSVKPIDPYEAWVDALIDPDEFLVVPCAGTAPAALAAERVARRIGEEANYICIDIEEAAYEAFEKRRKTEVLDIDASPEVNS